MVRIGIFKVNLGKGPKLRESPGVYKSGLHCVGLLAPEREREREALLLFNKERSDHNRDHREIANIRFRPDAGFRNSNLGTAAGQCLG